MHPEYPHQIHGNVAKHVVRLTLEIYGSTPERNSLRDDEEAVRFANFSVSEVMLNN